MSLRPTRIPFCLALVLVVAAGARVPGQCATPWLPGQSVPGTDGQVRAMTMWDPDGTGPMPPVLVVGGYFQAAGSARVVAGCFADAVAEEVRGVSHRTSNRRTLGQGNTLNDTVGLTWDMLLVTP